MMQWIDLYAAPLLVLLFLAAVGGFFVLKKRHVPLLPSLPVQPHRSIAGWLILCVLALLAMAGVSWCVWQTLQKASDATAACQLCVDGMALDQRAQAWVETQGQAPWLPVVRIWTHLADVAWMMVLSVLVAGWLLRRRYWLMAGVWSVGMAGIGLWIRLLKTVVERDRPAVQWVMEQGYSFPSGHSAGVVACYGLLAWIFWVISQRQTGIQASVVAALIALSVGATRVLLGVHYVSDVMAGWMLGLAWLAFLIGVAHWLQAPAKLPHAPRT